MGGGPPHRAILLRKAILLQHTPVSCVCYMYTFRLCTCSTQVSGGNLKAFTPPSCNFMSTFHTHSNARCRVHLERRKGAAAASELAVMSRPMITVCVILSIYLSIYRVGSSAPELAASRTHKHAITPTHRRWLQTAWPLGCSCQRCWQIFWLTLAG